MRTIPITKRALVAPFFVIAASLCLLRASYSTEALFWWPGLCLLTALAASQQERLITLSWLSAALAGFCTFQLVHALYFSPTYHADGSYVPATLMIAFVAAARRPDWLAETGFKIFCGIIALIAVWAMVQWLTGWGFIDGESVRALALFVTPNILAMTLNLGLAPILAYYLLGRGERGVYRLALLLFAALLAAQSRGGYLGLLASILFMVTFVGRASVVAHWQRYRAVAGGFLAVLAFFKLYAWLGLASWSMDAVFATFSHGDSSNRWEIYQVAWQGLAENLWRGIGYFNFGYYFEVHKVPPFLDRHITFVHNDYLQLALESGLLGLVLFLLLLVAVYGQLVRFRRQIMDKQGVPIILSAAAITSMLVHALVDYPFHIPFLLAVFGAYLAIINQQLIDVGAGYWPLPKIPGQYLLGIRPAFIGNALAIGLMTWMGLPAFAEVSADYGAYRLQQGDARRGLYWHGIARTLQPRTAKYYWREGIIWRELGVTQARPELLEKSDAIFSKGLEVNPFEVNNLLERIVLHRQHGALFKQPASHRNIMTWINQAKSLQPHSDGVQMEYVRCLDFVGEHAEAVEQARLLVHRRPYFKAAQKLLESVAHD